jgi:hypothetical protein
MSDIKLFQITSNKITGLEVKSVTIEKIAIAVYLQAGREPLRDEILDLLIGETASVLERKSIAIASS